MSDIVNRLLVKASYKAAGITCSTSEEMWEAADEIRRLRNALQLARSYVKPSHGGDVQADADLRTIDEALALPQAHQNPEGVDK